MCILVPPAPIACQPCNTYESDGCEDGALALRSFFLVGGAGHLQTLRVRLVNDTDDTLAVSCGGGKALSPT